MEAKIETRKAQQDGKIDDQLQREINYTQSQRSIIETLRSKTKQDFKPVCQLIDKVEKNFGLQYQDIVEEMETKQKHLTILVNHSNEVFQQIQNRIQKDDDREVISDDSFINEQRVITCAQLVIKHINRMK